MANKFKHNRISGFCLQVIFIIHQSQWPFLVQTNKSLKVLYFRICVILSYCTNSWRFMAPKTLVSLFVACTATQDFVRNMWSTRPSNNTKPLMYYNFSKITLKVSPRKTIKIRVHIVMIFWTMQTSISQRLSCTSIMY